MFNLALEPTWTVLLFLLGAGYLIVLEQIRSGIAALQKVEETQQPETKSKPLPSVSVIIPCRNEARHIGSALEDLEKQDYPHDLLQVIVVDDRSTDGSGEIARAYSGRLPGLIVCRLDRCPEGISPKKNAIQRGLRVARGEIIITTDGDCRLKPGWISALVAEFEPDVGLVAGLTIFDRNRPEPFWQRLQQLDYLSHSFFAAGAIGRGWAFNCNGSNLAVKRAAFEEVGGYDQFRRVVTGDDTLLLQRIRQNRNWRIRFSNKRETIVRSWPEETPKAVLNQRLRWGSGGLSYSPPARIFALTTFFFFLTLLLSPPLWISGFIGAAWMVIFALKVIQEGRIMVQGWKAFGLNSDWIAFLVLELVHITAILTFSVGGHLWGFRWKGQRFKRTRSPAYSLSQTSNL